MNRHQPFLCFLLIVAMPFVSIAEKVDIGKKAAAALRNRREQREKEKIKAQFEYTLDDISSNIVIITCNSERGRGAGSGFIATQDNKPYLFTNQHVILGADRIRFITASGSKLKPLGVELSTTRDIARLPLSDEYSGFSISKQMATGHPVAVFGNSEGRGIATELYGKIRGFGKHTIEVTATIVPGNSGSPVLNLAQEAIGIASFVSWAANEEYEDNIKTHRFCYRLTGNEWKTVNWKTYNATYGKLYADNDTLIHLINEIIAQWMENPFFRARVNAHPDDEMRKWATSHNHMMNDIDRMRNKGKATFSQLNNVNSRISKDLVDSTEDLAKICHQRARRMQFLSKQPEFTGFLRRKFKHYAKLYNLAAITLNLYAKELAHYNYFHFK